MYGFIEGCRPRRPGVNSRMRLFLTAATPDIRRHGGVAIG